jgi:hypothetical protein
VPDGIIAVKVVPLNARPHRAGRQIRIRLGERFSWEKDCWFLAGGRADEMALRRRRSSHRRDRPTDGCASYQTPGYCRRLTRDQSYYQETKR